jgi:hypothetical protein
MKRANGEYNLNCDLQRLYILVLGDKLIPKVDDVFKGGYRVVALKDNQEVDWQFLLEVEKDDYEDLDDL